MTKRSFQDYSAGYSTKAVCQLAEHADELLKAVQALKRDLERVQKHGAPSISALASTHGPALSTLSHNILPAIQELAVGRPAKTRKLDQPESDGSKGPGSEWGTIKTATAGPSDAVPVPPPLFLTPWRAGDVAVAIPPLPPVLDPVLAQAAVTHSGMTITPTDMSYERLEWLGDAYLYLMSTALIFQTFGKLPPGKCSQLRELLLRNVTLSGYTLQYGIDKMTRFPAEFDLHGRSGGSEANRKSKMKVLGDVFEAYVAGVILGDREHGLSTASSWMKSLWSTTISDELRGLFDESRKEPRERPSNLPCEAQQAGAAQDTDATAPAQRQDLGPKVMLQRTIGAKGVSISYKDLGTPKTEKKSGLPWFTVGVFLDGWNETNLMMGHGGGLSKKEAGAQAAQRAMENKKLMKRLVRKKEELKAVMAAQEQDPTGEP